MNGDLKPDDLSEIFDKHGNFIPYKFATYLTRNLDMKFLNLELEPNTLRILEDGVYKKDHSKSLVKKAKKLIGNRRREPFWYNKIYDLLKDENRADEQEGIFPGLHEDYINCRNGFVEIATGILIDHDKFYKENPKVISLMQIPVDYDEDATCPEFEGFLLDKQDNSQDDVDLIFQAVFGLSLLQYVPIPAFVEFQGDTHTGKSTVFHVLEAFLGEANCSSEAVHNLDNLDARFSRAALYGKLANIDADTSEKPLAGDGLIKKLSAGDSVSIEKKGVDPRTEKLFATIVYSANYDVKTADLSSGWEARMIRIPFDNSHEGHAIAKYEKRFTTDEELSGILNKALEGIRRLLKENRYIQTERTKQSKTSFVVANNPIIKWIDENLITDQYVRHKGQDKLARYHPVKFYNAYIKQTNSNIDSRKFYKHLKKMGGHRYL